MATKSKEMGTFVHIDKKHPETHFYCGTYSVLNGTVYLDYDGEVWHSYAGCVGYQSTQPCFYDFAIAELPKEVELKPAKTR